MKKNFLVAIFVVLFVSGFFYFVKFQDKNPITQNTVKKIADATKPLVVILSPHFDDGVLSLGGLIAKRENELLVATFFTKRPTKIAHTNWDKISGFSNSDEAIFTRTKENENALMPFNAIIKNYDYPDFQYRKENEDGNIRENIRKDIETLVKINQNRELFIYGPATFGLKITHPDHQIAHDAFMDVWKKNIKANVHFLIYEDFPYVRQFTMSNQNNLNIYLEKKESMKFEENLFELNKSMLAEKISAIAKYQSQVKAFMSWGDNIGLLAQKFYTERCKILLPKAYACEVTYRSP